VMLNILVVIFDRQTEKIERSKTHISKSCNYIKFAIIEHFEGTVRTGPLPK
jgi:hypothetical protein